MTDNEKRETAVSDQEIANMRHNVNLLRSQIQSGRVDAPFMIRQIEKIGSLLERVEAEQKSRRAAGRFEALYKLSRLLGSSLDLETVLDQVMDAILQLTAAERGFLMLRDDDGELTVKTARNFDQQTLSSAQFKYSRTIVNQVLDDGQAVVTTNAAEDPRFSGQASIVGQALRSIMATPLRARGQVIGVVYVDNRAIAGLFDEPDLLALDTFAGQAAIAIDNARLFGATDQQLQARLEELTQLRRVDLQLNETLDADKAMLYTLEWACRLTAATSGYLGLLETDPPRIRSVHSFGLNADETQQMALELNHPAAMDVIRTGNAVSVEDTQDGQTILIVPVRREQKVIGVVILRRAGAFTMDEQDLVERVVARAAVAIENARLYAAVRAADKAKSEFVGIVAHDMKVPMTSILGYADLTLMMGGLTDRQGEFQKKIRDTVKRMEMLVSDLADISRIESGHFYMNVTDVQVGDVVQAVKDNTLTQIAERKHTLVEEIEPDLPTMRIDYYRLLQVLTNLVSNAYKYTPEGGTITLSAQRNGDCIEFGVADTGIGLSKEAISMLGTKFWRSDDDYTRSQPGTGLGFAITRSLVEQMGGAMHIESEIGHGSLFSFCIPIGQE
jgi:signal transduction histidine kinase